MSTAEQIWKLAINQRGKPKLNEVGVSFPVGSMNFSSHGYFDVSMGVLLQVDLQTFYLGVLNGVSLADQRLIARVGDGVRDGIFKYYPDAESNRLKSAFAGLLHGVGHSHSMYGEQIGYNRPRFS